MKNYLPLGTGENRIEVIVQRWFEQHRQPTALGQIFNLDRFQSMIRPIFTSHATKSRSWRDISTEIRGRKIEKILSPLEWGESKKLTNTRRPLRSRNWTCNRNRPAFCEMRTARNSSVPCRGTDTLTAWWNTVALTETFVNGWRGRDSVEQEFL